MFDQTLVRGKVEALTDVMRRLVRMDQPSGCPARAMRITPMAEF